jgi:hypothetical protein
MRNKEEYQRFLMLQTERSIYEQEIAELYTSIDALEVEKNRVENNLRELDDYKDIDIEVAQRLMSSIVYDSVENPMKFNTGGGLTLPLDSFKDSESYASLNEYQKKEFGTIEPHINDCQLQLQSSIMTARDVLPTYSVDECVGVSRICNDIVGKHPNYEDLTSDEVIQLREIIYKFANYTID